MTKAEEIKEQCGGYWSEHPDFPSSDWRYEVENGDTRQGYWQWVESKIVTREEEESDQ